MFIRGRYYCLSIGLADLSDTGNDDADEFAALYLTAVEVHIAVVSHSNRLQLSGLNEAYSSMTPITHKLCLTRGEICFALGPKSIEILDQCRLRELLELVGPNLDVVSFQEDEELVLTSVFC